MNDDTHDCPGGCGRQVSPERLACRPDWYRLPKDIRDRIWREWYGAGPGTQTHRTAISYAYAWYRDNPRD